MKLVPVVVASTIIGLAPNLHAQDYDETPAETPQVQSAAPAVAAPVPPPLGAPKPPQVAPVLALTTSPIALAATSSLPATVLATVILPTNPADAPIEFKITGHVRLRNEVRRGLFGAKDPAGAKKFDITRLRNRFELTLKKNNLSAIFQAQDIRLLGGVGTVADSEGLDLRRGIIKVEKLAGGESWVEAGRMTMKYGDQRIIGGLEWVDQARTFDGSRLHLAPSKDTFVDIFATTTRETQADHNDQYFAGIYSGFVPNKGLNSEFYGLALIDRKETTGETAMGKSQYATVGTRQAYNNNGLALRFEGAAQYGELHGEDFLAYGAVLKLGYTVKDSTLKPSASVEGIYGSGDTDSTDGKQGTFQTLFPTNHMHYGYADQAAWSNLTSIALRASIKPSKRLKTKIAYHHFQLSDAEGGWFDASGKQVRAGSATAGGTLGDEIDAVATYSWRENLKVELGYGLFLPGSFVADTGKSEIAHFGYLQLAAWVK